MWSFFTHKPKHWLKNGIRNSLHSLKLKMVLKQWCHLDLHKKHKNMKELMRWHQWWDNVWRNLVAQVCAPCAALDLALCNTESKVGLFLRPSSQWRNAFLCKRTLECLQMREITNTGGHPNLCLKASTNVPCITNLVEGEYSRILYYYIQISTQKTIIFHTSPVLLEALEGSRFF